MNTLIIEDEQIAAQNLQRLIAEVEPELKVIDTLQSVEDTIEYFSQPVSVDLIFMDIHLADGIAFHIFDKATINSPIIFTTAYDQYALEAFKAGGMDYLLKPISADDLRRAVEKVQRYVNPQKPIDQAMVATMLDIMQPRKFKSYFLIPVRDKLIPLKVTDIAYIYVVEKVTHIVTFDNQTHVIDKPLDAIISQLDPTNFFRANRQYIISHQAVKDISIWPLSKLHITLTVPTPEKIIISRARTSEFKNWYTT